MKKFLHFFKFVSVTTGSLFLPISLIGQTTFNFTGTIDSYTVPAGVNSILIEVSGGSGGNGISGETGGLGAYMSGEFSVTPGQQFQILVGGQGLDAINGTDQAGGTGGGGSYVVDMSNNPIIIAGGGGGAISYYNPANGGDGQTGPDGQSGGDSGGAGGTGGNGGTTYYWTGWHSGTGGGGFYTDGVDYTAGNTGSYGTASGPGFAFLNGGAGGIGGSMCRDGAFGGGGAAGFTGGGGGGYSGGGSGDFLNPAAYSGGGGGSWNTGTNQNNIAGANNGPGVIIITPLCTGLTTSVSDTLVCEGETVTLSANSTGSGTVTWDNGVTNGVPFTPTLGTTTYTATSTDMNDCAFTVDITVAALPNVVAAVSDPVICIGDTVIFTGNGALTYAWDNGVTDGANYIPSSSGLVTYTVTGTDANGCDNTDGIDLMVSDPMISAIITHENAGNDGAIDLTVSNGTGTYNYTWSSGPTTEDITGLTAGTYTVTVDDGACTIDSTFSILNVSGIDQNHQSELIIYPNPVKDNLYISGAEIYFYQIVDLSGKVIFSDFGSDNSPINLETLSKGAYLINIQIDYNIQTYKLIKQ